jgi:hypothetical protein
MSILYRTRLYVAIYRLYGNLREVYLTGNTLTGNEYTQSSLLTLTTPLNLAVLQGAFTYANPNSTATNFSEITKFIEYCLKSNAGGGPLHTTLTLAECDELITFSRSSWDAPAATTDTIGTYTIVFFSGSYYVGKGNKSRCRTSAKERCEISISPSMDGGLWGDAEPNYKTGLRHASVSQSDQSFKEEAIKMLATDAPNSNQSAAAPKSYNKNNSPGLSKINSPSNTLGY